MEKKGPTPRKGEERTDAQKAGDKFKTGRKAHILPAKADFDMRCTQILLDDPALLVSVTTRSGKLKAEPFARRVADDNLLTWSGPLLNLAFKFNSDRSLQTNQTYAKMMIQFCKDYNSENDPNVATRPGPQKKQRR